MQALNKADITQANIRLTQLEIRKREARPGHSTGWSRLLLLFAQCSKALAQWCRSSGAGVGQQGRHCSPCPEPLPTAHPESGHQNSCRHSNANRSVGTFLHERCKSGKDHAEDWEIQLVWLLHCFFFQMWSKPLISTQKKRWRRKAVILLVCMPY